MAQQEGQDQGTQAGGTSVPDAASVPDETAPKRPAGWKFIVAWVAFAVTLLLTLMLGVQIVMETKALG